MSGAHRAQAGYLYSEAQGISQGLSQGKVGKELEHGSLFWVVKIHSHTMEISCFTVEGGDVGSGGD